MIHPFRIDVPDTTLDGIRARVREYPWHEMPDDGGWAYGTNLDYMQELCAYWLDEFDWRTHEAAINRFSHYTAPVDGIDLHFIHEKGRGRRPFAVAGRPPCRGPDSRGLVPCRTSLLAAPIARRAHLQHRTLDRDDARRPLCSVGAAGIADRGYQGVCPHLALGGYYRKAKTHNLRKTFEKV
jgi:hypothetical protein